MKVHRYFIFFMKCPTCRNILRRQNAPNCCPDCRSICARARSSWRVHSLRDNRNIRRWAVRGNQAAGTAAHMGAAVHSTAQALERAGDNTTAEGRVDRAGTVAA